MSHVAHRRGNGRSDVHGDVHAHADERVCGADETARDGNGLSDVAHDSDRDQNGAADASVGRIESDSAGTRDENLRPSMGGAGTESVGRRRVTISRYDARPEPEAARGFGEENGKVAARSPAPVERGRGRLGAFGVTGLVTHRVGDAAPQCRRAGRR